MERVMQQKNKFVRVVQTDILLSKCLKLSREHHSLQITVLRSWVSLEAAH